LALAHLRSLLDSLLKQEKYSGVVGHIGRPAMVEDAVKNRVQVVLTDVGRYRGDSSDLANVFASRVRNSKLNAFRRIPQLSPKCIYKIIFLYCCRSSLVVKTLGYKPEDCEFETRWREILSLPHSSGRTRPWGLLSLLTEMSIRSRIMFLGSKVRPVRGADNLTAIYEPIV
jgi:hypothetical protein